MSVNPSESTTAEYLSIYNLNELFTVAWINSPSNATVSGPSTSKEEFRLCLTVDGVHLDLIPTSAAYHSPAMKATTAEYLEWLVDIREDFCRDRARRPIAVTSIVTGLPIVPLLASRGQCCRKSRFACEVLA